MRWRRWNGFASTLGRCGDTSSSCITTAANTGGDTTFISNAKTTGNPNAVIFETQNWNPGGVGGTPDRPSTGVWWADGNGQAAVFNEDLSAMPLNAAFNLIIYQS